MTAHSMPTRPTTDVHLSTYGRVSRLNHWVTAAVFLGALTLGLVMAYGGLTRESRGVLMGWHKALGVTTLLYGLWRVGWRMAGGFAAPLANTPPWQAVAAKAVHVGLLTAVVAMPLSGIAMGVFAGRPLNVWSVTLLPAFGEAGWIVAATERLHEYLPYIIIALLAAHIGAALKHHLVDRDDTLARMTNGKAQAPTPTGAALHNTDETEPA